MFRHAYKLAAISNINQMISDHVSEFHNRQANAKYIAVYMDADLQDSPSLLPDMLSILERDEYDRVAIRLILFDK